MYIDYIYIIKYIHRESHSVISSESLRNARASNNPDPFSKIKDVPNFIRI